MDEHERPFAFPDIAADLLAVARLVTHKVEDVILNLETRTEIEPKQIEPVSIELAVSRNQCADPAWMDARIPARLFEDHAQVVVFVQIENIVTRPAELERLALD